MKAAVSTRAATVQATLVDSPAPKTPRTGTSTRVPTGVAGLDEILLGGFLLGGLQSAGVTFLGETESKLRGTPHASPHRNGAERGLSG